MATPFHHAISSSRKFGGAPEDYIAIHNWFDLTKAHHADFRHRALRHHSEGIFLMESIFGVTITISTGKQVPTRLVGEQHVQEDLGFIPAATEWLKLIKPEPWMRRSRRLSVELEQNANDIDTIEASGRPAVK